MNSIEVKGLDELIKYTEDMTLKPSEEKAAMKMALAPAKAKLEADTPKGYTKKLSQIKEKITREDFATVGKLSLGAWWDIFNEYGTSRTKKHVGFFERSINDTQDIVLSILTTNLLNKK